jgi:hypothetical protein
MDENQTDDVCAGSWTGPSGKREKKRDEGDRQGGRSRKSLRAALEQEELFLSKDL